MYRVKFGIRKNGTRWFHPLKSRKAYKHEIEQINNVLRMIYGEMQ